jgi:hypothetical protein
MRIINAHSFASGPEPAPNPDLRRAVRTLPRIRVYRVRTGALIRGLQHKLGFYFFWPGPGVLRRAGGGLPGHSVGLPGVSGAIPEASGTHHKPKQNTYKPENINQTVEPIGG